MSDAWTFSSFSPPIIHHSSLSQSSPFISSPAPLSVTVSHHQITSPPTVPETQVSSPYLLHQCQDTSPDCAPWSQTTSPHLFPQTQAVLPHPPPSQVTSPHHNQPQINSSHLFPQGHITSPHIPHLSSISPHLVAQPNVTPPHFVAQSQMTSSHLLSPSQYHVYNQSNDLDNSYAYQTTADLDLQNQFSSGVAHHKDELESTQRLLYNTHKEYVGDMYEKSSTAGPDQDTWRPLGPTQSHLQCSPQGFMSGEVAPGRWSSIEFSTSPAEDSSSYQFFHHNAPQPYCSPSTPGPNLHYPQTQTISSPGPQMYHRVERLDFHTQSTGQLYGDKTLSSCLQEYNSYLMISDQHQPHQRSQLLLQSQTELIQDQTGLKAARDAESYFSPQGGGQDLSSTVQFPGLSAGLSWEEECGRGRRRRGGENHQTDRTWMKQQQQQQLKNTTEVLDRLLCMVCKRRFRSLPALNGHMRSHSVTRSVTLLKKSEDPVKPAAVPVQSRVIAKVCRCGQRRCSHLPPATGHPALYRSLLHLDEEETFVGNGVDGGFEDGGPAVSGVHYTPPPMLCPLRAGTGLYCSLTTRRHQRVQNVQLHKTYDDPVAMETAPPPPGTLTINKWINVGRGFQAEIPLLQDQIYAHSDSHNALLLWTPWDVNQQRVEALLTMACSSVVPGGGASPESALHVLSEFKGDFLLTVEELLSAPGTSNHCLDQQYESVRWSAAERRLLVKSLQLHQKDFCQIQKAVRTKSIAQCVEFYYLWKKKLNLRTLSGLTVTVPDRKDQRSHDPS